MLDEQQQERFTQLWTRAQPSVHKFVYSLLRNNTAADDVVQNVSLALLRKFNEFDTTKEFLPWALGVAKFEVLSHRRDYARSRILANSDLLAKYTMLWAEIAPSITDEESELQICLTRLTDRQRKLMHLRYVEDLNSMEIGDRLGLSPANVRKMLERSRDAMKKCIQQRLTPAGGA